MKEKSDLRTYLDNLNNSLINLSRYNVEADHKEKVILKNSRDFNGIRTHDLCDPFEVRVIDLFHSLERFSNECRKTKTKVITLANQKGRRQSSKPIKTRSNYT